jgi:hypothetical protein
VHVPAQQPQPDVERDGARLNGPVRAIDSSAEAGPAEEHDSSIRNGHLAGLVGQEPLTELPPFPEDEPFAEEEPFPGVVRFGDDGSPSAKPEFAGEFVGAPVPADGEDTSVTAAKPARGGQARTRTSAKSPGGSQRKAGQPGQAKSPVRRKTSLTSPLQMPKRVRPRRPSDAAAAVNAATVAEDASVTPTAVDESANATAVDERVAVAAEYESVAVVAEDQSVAAVAEDESVAEPAEDESVASAGNVEQGPVEENEAESAEPDGAA